MLSFAISIEKAPQGFVRIHPQMFLYCLVPSLWPSSKWAGYLLVVVVVVCLFVRFCLLGPNLWHMESSKLGVKSELPLLAYTTAHGNAGSLTHGAEPGIKPATSWN